MATVVALLGHADVLGWGAVRSAGVTEGEVLMAGESGEDAEVAAGVAAEIAQLTAEGCDEAAYATAMERWLNALALMEPAQAEAAIEALIEASRTSAEAQRRVLSMAETYLYDPYSPWADEEQFRSFALEGSRSPLLSEAERTRYGMLVEMVDKNAPGTAAPDFAVALRDGRRSTLAELLTERELTVMVVYDPECDLCSAVMDAIAATDAAQRGEVSLVAVYADGDEELWLSHSQKVKAPWTDAFALEDIQDDDRYVVRATPMIFLIDSSGVICAKNPAMEQLLQLLMPASEAHGDAE